MDTDVVWELFEQRPGGSEELNTFASSCRTCIRNYSIHRELSTEWDWTPFCMRKADTLVDGSAHMTIVIVRLLRVGFMLRSRWAVI